MTMRRYFSERPDYFEIDPNHSFAQGLVFAGLGRFPNSNLYYDSSLYGNHGTLANMDPATDWISGLGRRAVDFDGSDDTVDVPQIIDDLIPSAFTFACFIRPAFDLDAVANSAANDKIIFGKYTSDSAYAGGFLWKLDTDTDKTQLACWNDSGTLVANTFGAKTSWSANEWYHLAVSWNGVGYSHWVNGELDLYTADSDRFGTTNQTLRIAKAPAGTATLQPLAATMADFLVYSRSLGQAEIKSLADPSNVMLSLGGSDPGLLQYRRRWWPVSGGAPPAGNRRRRVLIAGRMR